MKLLLKSIILLSLVCGAGYFYFQQKGLTLRFTDSDIEARLEEHFPFKKQALAIFDFTFAEPDVTFLPASDGISINMQLEVAVARIIKSSGLVTVSGIPSYRPDQAAFYLSELTIDEFQVDKLPDKYARELKSALSSALQLFYKDRPIYRLNDASTKQRLARMVLQEVTVTDNRLIVKFGSNS